MVEALFCSLQLPSRPEVSGSAPLVRGAGKALEAHKDSSESRDLLALEVKPYNCAVNPESIAPGLLHGAGGGGGRVLPSGPINFCFFLGAP